MKKRIVILGGGYAGVWAGKKLHKKLKKDENVEIILIDKKPFHTLMTELHEVAANRTPEDSVRVELSKIFAGRKVQVVLDEINDIDLKAQELRSVNNNTYKYDYLVLGTGAEPVYWGIDGAKENTFPLWSYEDALRIKEQILTMFRLAEQETSEAKRREMLTFIVVGAGFTGVEMAGELAEWTKKLAKEYCINKDEVRVLNVDALDKIIPMLTDKLQDKAKRGLERLGVEVLTKSPISKVTEDAVTIGKDKVIPCRTCIWSAGVKSTTFSETLGLTPGKRGGIQTNEFMQTVEYSNVYAVGDNISFETQEDGQLPKIVETAHFTAEAAAHNIAAEIHGKEKEAIKTPYHGFMVSLGSRYGVASLGTKKKMYNMSGFLAMFMKHFINMFYLFNLSGLNRVWTYLMHEFFHVKDRRSIVGGHFSKSSPNFWLVPLRMYLGFMWLIEGYKKIGEGWLKEVKMTPWYKKAAEGAVDAVGAASDVAGASGAAADTVAAASDVAGASGVVEAITDAVAAASDAVAGASGAVVDTVTESQGFIEWLVAKLSVPYGPALVTRPKFIDWFVDKIFTPVAVPMQTAMVLTEIVIGLCLIFGLFTFISSIISIVLTIAITMTGMSDVTILQYFFGAIALIGGSGSVLGLDYYVLPWLKEKWKKFKIAKKSYLYFD